MRAFTTLRDFAAPISSSGSIPFFLATACCSWSRVTGVFYGGMSKEVSNVVGAQRRSVAKTVCRRSGWSRFAGTQWGSKRYLNIDLLKEQEMEMELKSQLAEAV
jgi:hypothetical protein